MSWELSELGQGQLLSEFIEGMSFEETLESPNDPGGCSGRATTVVKANIGSDLINIS